MTSNHREAHAVPAGRMLIMAVLMLVIGGACFAPASAQSISSYNVATNVFGITITPHLATANTYTLSLADNAVFIMGGRLYHVENIWAFVLLSDNGKLDPDPDPASPQNGWGYFQQHKDDARAYVSGFEDSDKSDSLKPGGTPLTFKFVSDISQQNAFGLHVTTTEKFGDTNGYTGSIRWNGVVVPEPAMLQLSALSAMGVLGLLRRRSR